MALDALGCKLFVGTRDFKVRLIVIKIIELGKSFRSVAGAARSFQVLFFKLLLVNRDMTIRAELRVRRPAEFELVRCLFHLQSRNQLLGRNVAFPTVLDRLMLTHQFKGGRVVVKRWPRIELHGGVAARTRLIKRGF